MTSTIRAALDRHLARNLNPRARARARALRNALYASWTVRELRAEYVRVLGAKVDASGARNVWLGVLLDDLAGHVESRAEQYGPSVDARAELEGGSGFGLE